MGRRKSDTDKMFEELFGFEKAEPSTPKPEPPKPSNTVRKSKNKVPPAKVSEDPPPDWDPPVHMECGHFQVQYLPRPLAPGEDAYQQRGPSQITVFVRTPDECQLCPRGVPGQPEYQVGEYRKPVPPNRRRTLTKAATGGWPGYCCDEQGYYLGGLANDCRSNPDGKRCEVHRFPRVESSRPDSE